MNLHKSISAFFLAAVTSHGAVVVSTNNEVGPGGVGSTMTPSYIPSSVDLITGLVPSASGGDFAATEISGGIPVLNDGIFGTITEPGGAPDRTHLIFGLGGGGGGTGTFVTYTLDTSVNSLGYDINSIAVYGGWNDNGRDQQLYTAAYSLVGSSTFIDLPLVDFNPADRRRSAVGHPNDAFRGCAPVSCLRRRPNSLHLQSGYREWLRGVRRARRLRRRHRARTCRGHSAPRRLGPGRRTSHPPLRSKAPFQQVGSLAPPGRQIKIHWSWRFEGHNPSMSPQWSKSAFQCGIGTANASVCLILLRHTETY